MTIKQRKFIKKYIQNGGNGTKAARDTYNVKNYNTAHAIAVENLQKPSILREIEIALEAQGLSDGYISELLREATVAGLGTKATNSDSLRGLDMMLKLKDAYPDNISKSAHLRIDIRKNDLNNMNTSELEGELKKLQETTQRLLEDIKS